MPTVSQELEELRYQPSHFVSTARDFNHDIPGLPIEIECNPFFQGFYSWHVRETHKYKTM